MSPEDIRIGAWVRTIIEFVVPDSDIVLPKDTELQVISKPTEQGAAPYEEWYCIASWVGGCPPKDVFIPLSLLAPL